jgi:putative hydrolase of the HAD superfamily
LPVRAVVFDLGHTIWDIPPGEQPWGVAIERIYRRLVDARPGVETPSAGAIGRAIGLVASDWETSYSQGEEFSQPPSTYFISQALNGLDISVTDELIAELTEILFGSELAVRTVEPETRLVLDRLQASGLRLGCLTNTLLLEKAIVDLLDLLEMRQFFSSVVVSSEEGFRKPHPSLFQKALDELQVPPGESLFVGDSLKNDIAGAKRAGMLAVLTRQYRRESLDGASPQPDAVIERLSELPAAIERLAGAGPAP